MFLLEFFFFFPTKSVEINLLLSCDAFCFSFYFSFCLVGRLFVFLTICLTRLWHKLGGPTLEKSTTLLIYGVFWNLINREWNNLAKYWDTTFLYQTNNQIVLARPMEHPLVLYFNSCLKWLSTKELERIIILSTLTNFAWHI